jgi:hypothetical protein
MKRIAMGLICVVIAPAIFGQLTKVNVSRAQLTSVFGTARFSEVNAPIWTSGNLRSRVYRGQSGTPGAGLYVYESMIDLREVVGITAIPFVTSLSVDFGPVVDTLDFNADGKADQVFIVSKGALNLGNVAPAAVTKSGNVVTFTFDPPVGGGSSPGNGDRTFVFGVVSKSLPRTIHATAKHNLGGAALSLLVEAPNHP